MAKKEEKSAPAKKAAPKKVARKESTGHKVDVELLARLPTQRKFGYREVKVVVKDVDEEDISDLVEARMQSFDKALLKTSRFHDGDLSPEELIEYLS